MSYHYPNLVGIVGDPRSSRARIFELVRRYPQITESETAEILRFMRKGRHLDIGILTADESIQPQLDAFMRDNKSHLGVKWNEMAVLLGSLTGLFGMLWLLRELFA
jgi:hypothetical protein